MWAAINPMLWWDQVHSPLWLQVMAPNQLGGGIRAASTIATMGYSGEDFQKLGRWRSASYKT